MSMKGPRSNQPGADPQEPKAHPSDPSPESVAPTTGNGAQDALALLGNGPLTPALAKKVMAQAANELGFTYKSLSAATKQSPFGGKSRVFVTVEGWDGPSDEMERHCKQAGFSITFGKREDGKGFVTGSFFEGVGVFTPDAPDESNVAPLAPLDDESRRILKIRVLNDQFRTNFDPFLGKIVLTRGVNALGDDAKQALLKVVRGFTAFSDENDPHGEHDFGAIDQAGEKYFFKIDYYDKSLEYGSEDPSDPAQTTRVLTILHADEY